MDEFLNVVFSANFLFTTIRVMTPILFAALACMVFGKGGIDAIATEGIMLICALAGVLGSYFTGNAFAGLVIAMLAGAVLSILFAYVTEQLHTDPILAGIALNMFAGGITVFLMYYTTGEKGSTQSLNNKTLPSLDIPGLQDIPFLGQVLSGHNFVTYLGIAATMLLAYYIYRTPSGLRLRSVGENPQAAKSVGISVMKYKYIAASIAGFMAGCGGAFMSMGYVSFYSKDMIAGRGFIGMAAESMGRGTPIGVVLSSLLFGIADSLSIRLQMLNLPAQLIKTIPYIITIVAISLYSYSRKRKREKTGG